MQNRLPQKSFFLFYVLLIILISLLPSSVIKIGSLWKYDKIIHFFEYLILGFLFLNCFSPYDYIPQLLIMVIVSILIFSGIDEFIIQNFFTSTRIPDLNDWIMDIFGSSIGVIIRFIVGFKIK
tara:strand:- start:1599 stop:1967 length:369 start_codon:yes stop_codon:yes gene_type:complete